MSDRPTITPTGRFRHRAYKRMFRKEPLIVLQVEKRHQGYDIINEGGMVDSLPYDFTLWHDATVGDLREVKFS